MDAAKTRNFVETTWDRSILPALEEYIRIENLSPDFDSGWDARGEMERAVQLAARWIDSRGVKGLTWEVVRLAGRTPLLFIEIAGDSEETVLLYGHLDKQPPMEGWSEGLGPFTPVVREGKLYGRGGADDGYAVFAAVTAVQALQKQGIPHGRCVILVECCEESGSVDLPDYIEKLADRIGQPELIVCLDSGCGNYEQLWLTTSLRGMAAGTLRVRILKEGVHSGDASGVVPSSFRILRQLLQRLEDAATGRILPMDLHVEVPAERLEQAHRSAGILGGTTWTKFPFVEGACPVVEDFKELILNRTWRPQLAVTGADGMPSVADAGNVLRPDTAVKLSLRLPPTLDAKAATVFVKRLLEEEPPYGSSVEFRTETEANGWNSPPLKRWLESSLESASIEFFGKGLCTMGEGGSIPFMAMLGQKFPRAQFLITGVLGPNANAHGPNEFLEIATVKKLTCCVAAVLADHLSPSIP